MTRIDTCSYGTNQIGKPEFSRGGCWIRFDTYIPSDGREPSTESRFAAGKDDLSPMFIEGSTGRYHSDCASCWLGHSHTVNKHMQEVNRGQGQ